MSETPEPARHVRPFVHECGSLRSLHFSLLEVQSRMRLEDPCALDLEYTRTMMGFLLFKSDPQHIAMIGLGGGSLAKFCHRYLPEARMQVVEINPHVLALRDEFHVPPDGGRFSVLHGDGAVFVRDREASCDVLMVDGFDYDGQPSALSSQAFYDDCFERLQPDGILVVNLFSRHAQCVTFVDRIRRSFADQVLVVEGAGLSNSNSIVFACKGARLDTIRSGTLRPPRNLDVQAARQLAAGFALILSTLKDQRR